MKHAHAKTIIGFAAAVAAIASAPASAMDILARVISSTPVVQQVAVPRQVCNNEVVMTQAPRSGAGALIGAIAGGAAGNAIGSGGGRAAATVLGLVGGAMLGDRIEAPNNQLQNVQQCSTQTFYENRATYYNVVYEYQDTQYTAQMPNDPGLHVRLQVTPVGAMPAPQTVQPFQSTSVAPAPTNYEQQPVAPQPSYYQPAPVQQMVYGQPIAAPVYYPAYYPRPYYPRPYYAPSYAPIGLSLNFGYSRGFGGRHYRH